jgi:outer membrane lipoprotein-sorting protein
VSVGNQWVISGALIGLLCSLGIAQQTNPSGSMPLDAIIQSMQRAQAAVRPHTSYQIIREYRLFGAKDSQANSEVVAEINFRPPASRAYTIQKSSGSNRGPQVVRRILDREAELTSRENKASSAISNDNYTFNYIGEATVDGQSCYVLGLKPKRAASDLIAGQAWIDKHSFMIRQIEGEVEKTPSWWLKKVHVTLVFADLEGTWMQTSMEAVADVRIVGAHTLTSRILDYRREAEFAASPISAGAPTNREQ